jgi:regulator of RNase E activity RraA
VQADIGRIARLAGAATANRDDPFAAVPCRQRAGHRPSVSHRFGHGNLAIGPNLKEDDLATPDRPDGLSAEAIDALRQASTATITTQLLKRGFRNTFLTGLTATRPDMRMIGYAFTLRYVPMREDLDLVDIDNTTSVQRLAVEAIGPDDVLVIDARGDVGAATLGNILAERMLRRGAAGIVTDGAMRDTSAFREIDLPTYIRATHQTQSTARHHPADMNVPIGCAGVLVIPGDVVVGDADGVVIIPRAVAEEVALAARDQELREEFVLEKIRAGSSIIGVYPPDAATLAEFERRAARE